MPSPATSHLFNHLHPVTKPNQYVFVFKPNQNNVCFVKIQCFGIEFQQPAFWGHKKCICLFSEGFAFIIISTLLYFSRILINDHADRNDGQSSERTHPGRQQVHSSPPTDSSTSASYSILKNWTGCQTFGTLSTPSDKPASHDLQTGSTEPPLHHLLLHKEHISLPPFHIYAKCKSCSSWKNSIFFFLTPFVFFFFCNVQ